MPDFSHLGHGLVKQPLDERDYKLTDIVVGALPQMDFSVEFRLPEPQNENQNGSGSCVSQSTSYLHWQLHKGDWSRRDLYSRIFLPQSGAYLRDGVKTVATIGQALRTAVPDPVPQGEQAMRSQANESAAASRVGLEANYFSMNNDINTIAYAVKTYGGAVIGIYGNWSDGWGNLVDPQPPHNINAPDTWGHALYAFGFGMRNGKKVIICKSSWGTAGNTTVHYLSEDYITKAAFDCWCLVPKGNPLKLVNDGGTVYLVGSAGKWGIADGPALDKLKEIEPNVEDGSTAGIPQKGTMTHNDAFVVHN